VQHEETEESEESEEEEEEEAGVRRSSRRTRVQVLFSVGDFDEVATSSSVADPGCLSRIPDPKTATEERGEKKLVVIPFYVATNFIKL
jgi:hypothetical protein